MADNDDLLDYEEEENTEQTTTVESGEGTVSKKEVKGTYVSIHSSGFRDFLLKPEILRAIIDCGFEHPSEGKNNKQKHFLCYSYSLCLLLNYLMRCLRLHSRFPLNFCVGAVTSLIFEKIIIKYSPTIPEANQLTVLTFILFCYYSST